MRSKFLRAGLTLAILGIALVCPAPTYHHVFEPLQTTGGEAISGASVYVYTIDTTDTVAIYSDAAGTWKSNPFTTGADGMIDFYVASGTYDIYYVHSGRNLSDTWEDYAAGYAWAEIADVDTARVAELLVLDGATWGTLQFGRDGNTGVSGKIIVPDNHTLWVTRSGSDADTQRLDGSNRYSFGIGGGGIQFQEESVISFGVGDADDSTTYVDRNVIYLLADDDTKRGDTRQTLVFDRTHADTSSWMWRGKKGAFGGDFGTPDYAFQFRSNLPDSNSTTGKRGLLDARWLHPSGKILSANSYFLGLHEHNTLIHSLERDGYRIYQNPAHQGASPYIILESPNQDTTAAAYSKITHTGGLALTINACNKTVRVRDYDNSNDAKLDVYQGDFDILTIAPLSGALPGTSAIQALGTGTAYFRHFDAEPAKAGTLFIWDNADSVYHYWIQDGTKAAP